MIIFVGGKPKSPKATVTMASKKTAAKKKSKPSRKPSKAKRG